jgi:hypothetical protein
LIGVFEIAADGQAAGKACDFDTQGLQLLAEI